MMQAALSKNVIHAIENVDTIELWHKRFSYMSEKRMMFCSERITCLGCVYKSMLIAWQVNKIELLSRHTFHLQENRICLTWSILIYKVQ